MSHDFHERLPDYDAGNIWHDGCEECEERAASGLNGLHELDHRNFRQAWADMLAAKWSGGEGLARNVSACDSRLLNTLYALAVVMERATGQDPSSTLMLIDVRNVELEAELAAMFGPRP